MAEYVLVPQETRMSRANFLELCFGRIGHDFLGQTFALRSGLRLLSTGFDRIADERKKRFLSELSPRARHVDQVSSALRTLALGSDDLSYDGFSVCGLLEDLGTFGRSKWPGLNITVDVPDDLSVQTSAVLLYTQLWNFVSNAYDAYPESQRGLIELSSGELALSEKGCPFLGVNGEKYTVGDPFVRVSVRDYGPGIASDDLERIFEAGVSGRGSSGIGLALAEETCLRLHGYLRVESEQGSGSTFSLYFPRERVKN